MNSALPHSYLTLIRHHSGVLAVAFLAVFTGNLGQSFFIGLFQQPISEHLHLTAGEFGKIYAVITITAGFLIMYFGPKIDWVNPRRYALFILSALLLGLAFLSQSSWWFLGVIGLGLVRLCGQGLMTHLGSTLAAREFSLNRGRALGIIGLAMPTGEVILPPLTALLLIWLSWQQVWWSIWAFIVLLWLVLFLCVDWPEAPQEKKKKGEQQYRDTQNPMFESRFWLLMPMLLVLPITLTGIFLYQAQLSADLGASSTTYALALTAMGLFRFPVALFGGRLIDELGVSVLARVYLLPYALALLMASLMTGNSALWILMLGAGMGMSISSSVGDSLLVKLWGKEHLGRVRSLKSAFLVFSTGITPALLGVLLDRGVHFQSILMGMLVFLIMSCLLAQAPIKQAQA